MSSPAGLPTRESAAPVRDSAGPPIRDANETLYAIIETVGSSLDLDRVLDGFVGIVTRATACHACFVYFLERQRLILRAASGEFAGLVGRIELRLDEGLAGWVARTGTPEFIRENAFADPRMKYVPELEEERYQSIVAVPVPSKAGDVIGVVTLHTVAPREFDDDVLRFLVHTASLVGGAIENAQLYERARRQVVALTALSEVSRAIAAVSGREDLYRAVTEGLRELLGVEASLVYLLADGARLELAAADTGSLPAPRAQLEGTGLLLDLLRHEGREATGRRLAGELWPRSPGPADRTAPAEGGAEPAGELLVAPLSAGGRDLGILCCFGAERRAFDSQDHDVLTAIANQAAVSLQTVDLIERLTAKNIVKDMFDALAAGSSYVAETKAAEAGCDLAHTHVFLHAEPASAPGDRPRAWPAVASRLEQRVRVLAPTAFFDLRPNRLRALLALGEEPPIAMRTVRAACEELGTAERVAIGLSGIRAGARDSRRSLREAADAARLAAALGEGAAGYDELGAYKYLVHLPLDELPQDRHWEAVERLLDYDRRRRTRLLDTLERYLQTRSGVRASARALYIHPNTLRQRLARIELLSGLSLDGEDLLSLELAIKLVRLRSATSRDRRGADEPAG